MEGPSSSLWAAREAVWLLPFEKTAGWVITLSNHRRMKRAREKHSHFLSNLAYFILFLWACLMVWYVSNQPESHAKTARPLSTIGLVGTCLRTEITAQVDPLATGEPTIRIRWGPQKSSRSGIKKKTTRHTRTFLLSHHFHTSRVISQD
jgi:hypothetical protein